MRPLTLRPSVLLVARMTCVEAVNLSNERPGSCLAEGRHVHAVLPLPGDRLLFTNGDTRSASLVARRSGALLTTFKTGPDPDGAVFDPAIRAGLGHGMAETAR